MNLLHLERWYKRVLKALEQEIVTAECLVSVWLKQLVNKIIILKVRLHNQITIWISDHKKVALETNYHKFQRNLMPKASQA